VERELLFQLQKSGQCSFSLTEMPGNTFFDLGDPSFRQMAGTLEQLPAADSPADIDAALMINIPSYFHLFLEINNAIVDRYEAARYCLTF
jgi:hypothetical protein